MAVAVTVGAAVAVTVAMALPCEGHESASGHMPQSGLRCVADGASVKNQTVTEVGPLLRRETGGDLPFDGHWIGIGMPPVAAPTQPSGHAHHMSVYRKAGNMEGIAQHHIRGFPPHAGQAGQLIHGARHFAVEATGQHLSQSQQMLGLRAVEPKRADNAFHVLGIGAGPDPNSSDKWQTIRV